MRSKIFYIAIIIALCSKIYGIITNEPIGHGWALSNTLNVLAWLIKKPEDCT